MPITAPSVGDPTYQTLIVAIIDALAAAEVDIAAIVGERLVTNGSFEVDSDSDGVPDQWTRTLYTGGAFSLVSDTGTGANSAHGLKAIKFTHPGGGGNGGGEIVTHADTYIEVTPNRSYWLSWMNKNSVAGVTNSVDVLEYDATQTLVATTTIFSATTNPTAWKRLVAIFYPADAATRYIKLKFKCGETSASTAGDIYIDDVRMTPQAQQELNLDTAGTWKWTCPAGVRFVQMELIGGGGGGGGCNGAGTGGGGGGAGGYLYAHVAVTPGTTYDVTIGAGGTGGTSGTSGVGTSGGSSTITIGATTYTAAGGTAGTRGSSGGAGGSGGTTTNGDTGSASGTSGGNGTNTPTAGSGGYSGPQSAYADTGASGTTGFAGPLAGGGGSGGRTGTTSGGDGHAGSLILRW